MPAPPAACLSELSRAGLPSWAEPYLAPPGEDFFASRLWFDLVLAHALPDGAQPLLAECATDKDGPAAILPLLRDGQGLAGLTTPYSLSFRPLPAPGADLAAAGASLGRALRFAPPMRLELLDPAAPGIAAFRAGLARAGIWTMAFDHVGNWHQVLPPATTWDSYLAARPSALRTTITRKLSRARRDLRLEPVSSPGPALEAAIAAYESARAASWKPHEPFPDFDRHLLRAAAAAGVLRMGVLRGATDSQPVAAQYWILDRGPGGLRRATVLKLAHAETARALSPGTVLSALMIRQLLEEDGVGELDFGRGDDAYKRDWVSDRRQRIGLMLAHPWHPMGATVIARQVLGGLRRRLKGAEAA
jgi:hypothetical protein